MEIVVVELGLYDHVPAGRKGEQHQHELRQKQRVHVPACPRPDSRENVGGHHLGLRSCFYQRLPGVGGVGDHEAELEEPLWTQEETALYQRGQESLDAKTSRPGPAWTHLPTSRLELYSAAGWWSLRTSGNSRTPTRGPEVPPGCSGSDSAHHRLTF